MTAFLIISTFFISVSAQNQNYSVPAKWELYSVKDKNVSFLMPRLPIVVEESKPCQGEQTFAYGSYIEGAAYVVRITVKIDAPRYCEEKKEFDETNFEKRVSFLKSAPNNLRDPEKGNAKSKEITLVSDDRIVKLVNDSKNKRWFEFLVVGADDKKADVKNFLASLKKDKQATGVEIGDGAAQMIGDKPETNVEIIKRDDEGKIPSGRGKGSENSAVTLKPKISSNTGNTEGVKIILKPRSKYTETARENQIQGKVVLRVTFSAFGGIGAIIVVSGLSDGLTEQAIDAARKILFIPASRGGVRYSVMKPVEYTFTIY